MAMSSLEPWRDLSGKIVMVTGASSGLGWELCIDLAAAGCKVVAAARRVDRLKSLCYHINQPAGSGIQAVAVKLDVTADGSTIQAAVHKAWDAFGHIDALINNAGTTGKVHQATNLPEEEWDRVFKTNLYGSWLVSKYVCQRMCDANQGGSLINISSVFGVNRGLAPGTVAYCASKAGLNTMTKVMALELGSKKIRVNSISPGLFDSEMTHELLKKERVMNFFLKTAPMRDVIYSNPDMTALVRYLIHDSSQYVTGNIFIMDGGVTLPGVPLFSSL